MELNIGIAMLADMKQTKNTERFDIVENNESTFQLYYFQSGQSPKEKFCKFIWKSEIKECFFLLSQPEIKGGISVLGH